MENGSILIDPQMRLILASLDSIASTADRIQKEDLKPSCLRRDSNPDLIQQPGSIHLSRRFNPTAKTGAINPLAKQSDMQRC